MKPESMDVVAVLDGRRLRTRRTQRAIVVAASELFVTDGYGSTSITAIAERAGVAVQTVYASFKTKRAILAAALDQAIAGGDEPVAVNERDWMHDVFTAATPALRLRSYAAAVRRILTSAGDMFVVVATAATVDPEVVDLAETAEARRRVGATSVIDSVLSVGSIRSSLDREEAIDVLWLLNSPSVFHHLVRRAGWTLDRYEAWLADTMTRELLGTTRHESRSSARQR